jgi:hypothetical protein
LSFASSSSLVRASDGCFSAAVDRGIAAQVVVSTISSAEAIAGFVVEMFVVRSSVFVVGCGDVAIDGDCRADLFGVESMSSSSSRVGDDARYFLDCDGFGVDSV